MSKINQYNSTLKADPAKRLKSRKPMNRKSKKKKALSGREQRWKRAVFERDHERCQIIGCTRWAEDPHHIWEVGARPEWKFVLENGIALCRTCHRLVHAGKVEFKNMGMVIAQLATSPRGQG